MNKIDRELSSTSGALALEELVYFEITGTDETSEVEK